MFYLLKVDIDIDELKNYVHDTIYDLLQLPFERETFLQKYDPKFNEYNVLWINWAALSVKQFIEFKQEGKSKKVYETPTNITRGKNKINRNAEKMKEQFSKRKKIFTQAFDINDDDDAVNITQKVRSNVSMRRILLLL